MARCLCLVTDLGGVLNEETRAERRVPGYVADTLADVCGAGLMIVVGANASGVARIALTDAGCSRYARLGAHHIGRGRSRHQGRRDPRPWLVTDREQADPDARGSRRPAGHQDYLR